MDLRDERAADHDAIRDIHVRAFGPQGSTVADLVNDLRARIAPDMGLSLVADDAGEIVGHVMFTGSLLDAPPRLVEVQVLSPLAVAPQRQREGIGAALVLAGLRGAARQAAPLVFVEGDPAYYSRFGFMPATELGFRKPSLRIPDAAFQVIRLPAYQEWMTGTLVYAEPFWRHDLVGVRKPAGG